MTTTSREMGLIKVASHHKHRGNSLEDQLRYAELLLVRTHATMDDPAAIMWEYVEEKQIWWHGSANALGKGTVIKPYTNKRGATFLAHYTIHGQYLHRAKEGDKAEDYSGFFPIERSTFQYVWTAEAKTINQLFQPIAAPIKKLMKRPTKAVA